MNLNEKSLQFELKKGTFHLSYKSDALHKPNYTTKTTASHLKDFDTKMKKISLNIECSYC